MLPDNREVKFWHAIALANIGQLNEALPIFKDLFAQDANWATVVTRLQANGFLQVDDAVVTEILKQSEQ